MSGPSSSPFLKLILSILTPFSLSNQQILGAKTDNFLPLGSISGSKAKKQTCKQKVGLFYGIKKKNVAQIVVGRFSFPVLGHFLVLLCLLMYTFSDPRSLHSIWHVTGSLICML